MNIFKIIYKINYILNNIIDFKYILTTKLTFNPY